MKNIIGREKEISELNKLYNSNQSQFIVIYGRRRIGKTFLIDETFKGKITFRHAGLSHIDDSNKKNLLKDQLKHFYHSLQLHGMKKSKCPTSWLEAFFMLEKLLENIDDGKHRQIVFLDELPWMDTPRSGFITAFEGFWNTWACHRSNLMLIVCGSANAWILDNLINNHGGLYGRTTYEIKLQPFTLYECEKFFKSRNISISRYDIVQSYMMLGGIPYYLNYFKSGLSLVQNIDLLFFDNSAKLAYEFDRLFASLFINPEEIKRIVRFIGTKHAGFTRSEIAKNTGIDGSGNFSNMLKALIASNFIIKYTPFDHKKREEHYKLIDPFCLFYMRYVQGHSSLNSDFWKHNNTTQSVISWRGFSFEEVCLNHIRQIKNALGIQAVATTQSAWSLQGDDEKEGTQIDLLINRNDNVVNMCEIKFYNERLTISKSYHDKITHRINMLSDKLPKRKAIIPTIITTFGVSHNEYSGIFTVEVTIDDLFKE